MAVHLAEECQQKGQPFLMPQTERALVAHDVLSRFLKAFINRVSDPFMPVMSCSLSKFNILPMSISFRAE